MDDVTGASPYDTVEAACDDQHRRGHGGTGTPSSSRLLGEPARRGRSRGAGGGRAHRPRSRHIELRTLAVDLANHLATGVPGADAAARRSTRCGAADGVIVVTPVFNGSYSGLFKLFFDVLDEDALRGRPVLLAATGGTARHSLVIEHAMLPLFFYLQGAGVSRTRCSPRPKDWGSASGKLNRRITCAADDFATLVLASNPPTRDDEFEVPDFTDLLGG